MTPTHPDYKGIMAALCTTATWGMVGIFIRWLPGWSPFAILAGRFLVATAVMLPIFIVAPTIRRNLTRSLSTPLVWVLSLPVIGSYLLGTTAFQLAPVGEVTLFLATSPVFILAYRYVAQLPIKPSEGIGMGMAIAGIGLILWPQLSVDRGISGATAIGYILALGAAGLLALFTGWFNALNTRAIAFTPTQVAFATYALGSILSLLCTILFVKPADDFGIHSQTLVVFAGLGSVSTALPFWAYTIAARRLPVLLSTAILLLEPAFAVLFASMALQELPSPWFGAGSVFACWGLLTITRAAHSA